MYVNGQRYGSDNAAIAVGNSPAADEAQLRVGMVVTVAASASDNGEDPEAEQITYEESLQGPVAFIDREAEQIEVLGQTVIYDDLTEFEETDLDTLTVGDFIEISGYVNENGDFYATLVELEAVLDGEQLVAEEVEFKARNARSKVEGKVTDIDAEAMTFVLNETTFTVTSETQYEDESDLDERRFTFDNIEVNDWLKVVSRQDEEGNAIALKVKRIEEDDLEAEVKGRVSAVSTEGMTVANASITFDENTEFEDDDGTISLEDFIALVDSRNAVIVEVEGQYVDGSLVATEVEIENTSEDDSEE